MDLWIRSQDKDILLKTHELFILKSEFKENVYFIRSSDCCLANYDSKERALEVLDEIQNKINLINLGHDFGSPMVNLKNPTYIYQMPEE